ncbi:MAG: radical SAM protein [Patescibacteria group bacterium]
MSKPKKIYATFVLPAPNGCNLDCAFCVIAHRREAIDSRLIHEDYLRFLTDILVHMPIARFSIQGYEPLLPETWPLTKALLEIAGAFFCETSFVTNGTYLAEHARELGAFPGLVDAVTISIDSADPAIHDKLRRKSGALERALEGIMALRREFSGDIAVNSVLFPGKMEYLKDMPQLLANLGVREWIISPHIRVGSDVKVPHGEDLKYDLLELSAMAHAFGVKVLLSDELRLTEGSDLYTDLYVRSLKSEDEIFRLSPDSTCSRGLEILGTVDSVPEWDGAERPSLFLRRIFAECGVSLQSRSKLARVFASWHANRIA